MTETLSLDEVKELVRFCRGERVARVVYGGLTVEFSPLAAVDVRPLSDDEVATRNEAAEREYRETLMHSAGEEIE